MNTFACKGVKVCRQGGNKRFALARFHFAYSALMQNNTAQNLHGEVTHSQNPIACLAAYCKRLGEYHIKRFTCLQAVFKLVGFVTQLLVRKCAVFLFIRKHLIKYWANAFYFFFTVISENSF